MTGILIQELVRTQVVPPAFQATCRKDVQQESFQAVFIQNSPFDKAAYFGNSRSIALPCPTDCTLKITKAALYLLKHIYKQGIYYQKAGFMLLELVPEEGQQSDLFGYSAKSRTSNKLMSAIDGINNKYSRGTIKLASEGMEKAWVMRRSFKSPNYTGDRIELPKVR